MKIMELVLILLTLSLPGCALNQDFPKEIQGDLKPINSQKVMRDVEP